MFRIIIKPTRKYEIVGCPDDGVAAVDFRRSHGIPPAPHDKVSYDLDYTSEAICRRFQAKLNGEADLDLDGLFQYSNHGDHQSVSPAGAALAGAPINNEVNLLALVTDIMSLPRQRRDAEASAATFAAASAAILAGQDLQIRHTGGSPGYTSDYVYHLGPGDLAANLARLSPEAQAAVTAAIQETSARAAAQQAAEAKAREDAAAADNALIRNYLTPEEQRLQTRDRLDLGAVRHRLQISVLCDLDQRLADIPKPAGHKGNPDAYIGHKWHGCAVSTWTPDLLLTIEAIEAVTGHPVVSASKGCWVFNTHTSVPWLSQPMPIHIEIEQEAEEEEESEG